jgi:hypothetical protein
VQQIMEEKQKNDEVGRCFVKRIQSARYETMSWYIVRQHGHFGARTLRPHIVTFLVLLVTRNHGGEKA